MKKLIVCLKNNEGVTGAFVILACCVIGLASVVVIEVFRYFTIKENIDKNLSRASNMAIDLSMQDDMRRIHISSIDTDIAIQEFYKYLYDELQLDDQLKYNKDNLEYQLYLKTVNVESNPPKFEVEGTVILEPELFKELIPYKIEIPVKAKARNQRMD